MRCRLSERLRAIGCVMSALVGLPQTRAPDRGSTGWDWGLWGLGRGLLR